MSEPLDHKPILEDAKNAADTAFTCFARLRALFAAIQQLATAGSVIGDLAGVGADMAIESANESRSVSDELSRLITNAEGNN
ncbi:hypothetical protein BG58_31355 [Caballeronia jiangsuensis]|nr:hypothetical protein BG58_31355 [Caballeronia jiangsuensis]